MHNVYIFTWWPRWFVWLPEWPPPIPWWWWYDDITSCLSWVSGPGDPVDPGPSDPLPWPLPLPPFPGPGDWWLWWWWCLPMSTAASTSALLSRPSLRPPNKSPCKNKKIQIQWSVSRKNTNFCYDTQGRSAKPSCLGGRLQPKVWRDHIKFITDSSQKYSLSDAGKPWIQVFRSKSVLILWII